MHFGKNYFDGQHVLHMSNGILAKFITLSDVCNYLVRKVYKFDDHFNNYNNNKCIANDIIDLRRNNIK